MEWVVETGAPRMVARFSHRAPASRAEVISRIRLWASSSGDGVMIPLEMVLTTSPPASRAPAVSQTAAMIRRRSG